MTTIVIVRKNGVAAIGGDTLWKDGSTLVRATRLANHSKILRVGESYIAFTGTLAWQLVLGRYFGRSKRPPDLSSAPKIFEAVLRMRPVMRDRYGVNSGSGSGDFDSSQFELLVANPGGVFAVYHDRAVQEYMTFYSIGSGSDYALGAMHEAYRTMERPEDIARAGIEAAAEFDEDTGLPAEVYRVELSATESVRP